MNLNDIVKLNDNKDIYYALLEYTQKLAEKKERNDSKKKLYEFINARSKIYMKNTSKERMIIDYISGQTDSYFLNECEYNFKEFKKENLYK